MTELGRRSDGSPYRIPFSFEELGASPGEASYIAVVHIDGNNLGARVEMIAANHNRPAEGNRAYITAIRQFSRSVRQAAETSLERLRREIIASVRGVGAENETIMGIVPVRNGFIPYRPLVFGGDDLTFVCDGRLALTLVAYYLQTFEQETANAGLPNLRACAGISVVKSHYPFARAYELAEALCRNAKKWAKENGGDCSALDWHIAPGGLVGDLDFIRAREYAAPGAGSLLMRPIALDSDRHEWRNWSAFKDVVTAFKKDWADKRNKVKRLQEALRAGPEGVAQFLAAYPDPGRLPAIKASNRNIPRVGWDQGRCAYFDAIEAMEFFVPLHYEGGQL
ncbi:MAG: hypothetical protein ACE5G8_07725, partial [Anaerolineae bacterium]